VSRERVKRRTWIWNLVPSAPAKTISTKAEHHVDRAEPESERTSILESNSIIGKGNGKMEERIGELGKELDIDQLLEFTLRAFREKNVIKPTENDRTIVRSLEAESDLPTERSYPTRGVFTVGLLLALIGSLILLPIQIPSTLKFVFGAGFLLVGFSVVINSLVQSRKRSTHTSTVSR